MNTADFECLIDVSEDARALGAASAEEWLPGFMLWAAPRIDNLEILLIAAHCDGFRKGLKATLPKSEAEAKAERIAKWRAERIERTKQQDEKAQALHVADLAQQLGR